MKIGTYKHGWLRQKFHFCIVAKNNEVVAQSETYRNEKDMIDSVQLITECKEWKVEKSY